MVQDVFVDRIEDGIAVMLNERDQTEIRVALQDLTSISIREGDLLSINISDEGAIQILDKRTDEEKRRRERIQAKQKKLAGRKSGSRFKK
ncbi:DUF3006 domain-containing protein [Salisediminibacterium selenitireducens]|uniref:DUF3006 domain-containing protein n=1 Tax=Bacillus selenitireducens (strain ATCC 700615 / DSM 15326 / MLS10) TaxID=439292 RepID=D6XWU5_BACIE|nr:DUF3006 domain-containing protein [Salisediminibacterium selenitireducens]ADH99921.1 hypothetical protein Bsel_2419 [[Bacillus] selenitireducens MLS10]